MDTGLERYLLAHVDTEDDYLYRLYRVTNIHTVHRHMASEHLQGRLLKMLVEMIRPKNALEVGTFSGYSVIYMAEGLGEDGQLYTFGVNDEMEDFTRPWIEDSPMASKIQFITGDANVEAPRPNVVSDMTFIDGDKHTYVETFETVLKLSRPGGFTLTDNTLWDGHVMDPHYQHGQQTQGIVHLNDFIAQDVRMEEVILPIRDGLTTVREKLNEWREALKRTNRWTAT